MIRFLLTGRFFIIPAIGGAILFWRHWFPAALPLCVSLNALALVLAALEYFLMPDADALEIERLLPHQFFHRRPATVELRMRSHLPVGVRLRLQDRAPPSFQELDPLFTRDVPRGTHELTMRYTVRPRQRGEYMFSELGIRMTTRIGLIARQFTITLPQKADVYPPFPKEHHGLLSRFYFLEAQNRLMRTYGAGSEFHQMREYKSGDDMRAIHWKRSARSNRLIVKEFEPERGQNVFMLVDGGRLMLAEYDGMSKVDWGISSCVSLAQEALRKHDAVGICCFSNSVDSYVMPSNKKDQLTKIIKATYGFHPRFLEPDYRAVLQWVYGRLRQRSILIVFTDFFDSYLSSELSAHIRLLRKRHRVICCSLSHPGMVALATAQARTLREAMVSAVVRENLDNRAVILKGLRQAHVDIVEAEPEELNGAVLSAYLHARWG